MGAHDVETSPKKQNKEKKASVTLASWASLLLETGPWNGCEGTEPRRMAVEAGSSGAE